MTPHIDSRQFYRSTLSVVLSALLLMTVALLVGCSEPEPTPSPSPVPTAPPEMATPALVAAATLTPTSTVTSPTTTPVLTVAVTATGCPTPTGWVQYTVAEGDTLSRLGATSGASVTALMQANCLVDTTIYVGQTLYLPVAPPPTATLTPEPTRCGAPAGWVVYVVQPGDTLSVLASRVGASVEEIRLANCLPDDTIYAGRGLRLPQLPGGTDATAGGIAPLVLVEAPMRRPPTPACIGFDCAPSQPQDPPLSFGSGSPGVGNLCSDVSSEIGISIGGQDAFGQVRVLPTAAVATDGTAAYAVGRKFVFGACNVGAGEHVTFSLTETGGGTKSLPSMTIHVAKTPVPSANWRAGCEEAGRRYTVSFVTESPAMAREQTFDLTTPIEWAVFFEPLGGRRYQVDFCYENLPDDIDIIDLRLFHGKLEGNRCKATAYWDGQSMGIDVGTASASYILYLPLLSVEGDCYVLRDETTGLEARVVIPVIVNDGQ